MLFISHSSRDKRFVRHLVDQLSIRGHKVWLDEYRIKVGRSITKEIQRGLESADFVILVLSSFAVQSGWVEREWMTRFWRDLKLHQATLLPVIIEDCSVPTLIEDYKYADFRRSFSDGFSDLIRAIEHPQLESTSSHPVNPIRNRRLDISRDLPSLRRRG